MRMRSFPGSRVRKQLLPLMQSFNNRIVEALSRTATLLREDADVLSLEAEKLLTAATASSELKAERKFVFERKGRRCGASSRATPGSPALAGARARVTCAALRWFTWLRSIAC